MSRRAALVAATSAAVLAACGSPDDGRCTLPTGADAIRSAPLRETVPPPGDWNVTLTGSTPRYVIKLAFKGDQGIFASSEPHAGTYPVEHSAGCGACLEASFLGPDGRLDAYSVDAQLEATTVTMTDITAVARNVTLAGDGPLDGCAFDAFSFASAH